MKFSLPYGTRTCSVALPDALSVQAVRLPHGFPNRDVDHLLRAALDQPLSSVTLGEYLKRGAPVTIVVPDKTRLSGISTVLPLVIRFLHERGVPRQAVRILFANGTHGPQTDEEKRSIVGDAVVESYPVFDHDPHDEKGLTKIGRTSGGTDVRINTLAAESPVVIAIGAVIHHYFAGFGGGPKLIVPGIAAYSTALQNHRKTLTGEGDFHPACREGVLDGNPVYEDIVEALRLCSPVFFIGTILDPEGNISEIVAGDPIEAHRAGAAIVDRIARVPIRRKTDVVIVSGGGYPKDITMIQAHKAIHHAFEAVREGGRIICCAECRDGIGSATFMKWFEIPTIAGMQEELVRNYTLNGHTALSLRKKLGHTTIDFVSSLEPATVRAMGMIPAAGLDSALAGALASAPSPTMTVIENGAACLPTLEK